MVANNSFEQELKQQGYKYICGIDETAIGTFVGDVYVGAVILPIDIDYKNVFSHLNDSKTKTPEQRNILYKEIKQNALCWAVGSASVEEIDTLNIYWAKWLAARRALNKMSINPEFILVDGNKIIPEVMTPQKAIVKGDLKSISIAAASILAKVDRDAYMDELAKLVHSDYGWDKNRGYYCKETIDALKKHGKTIWHRKKYIEKYI